MKMLLDFLTLPLSLPISPFWDFLICLVLGEIAYRVAYSLAGEYGSTSVERGRIHWIIRIPFFFILWIIACVIIKAVMFVSANLIWILIAISVLAIIGLSVLLVLHIRQKKKKQDNSEEHREKSV